MSSIYKLSISGIRSFSDETQETIQFSKPLTLIVGTNGSGKTTIIECLRYATTNELPPNTKNGASFINDPNLHSSNETKAQIKLAFQNTKRVNMILSKSLIAIKNPRTNQISFKTKENQLMAIHHGEKQTISSKVADIENLIPYHLGVSKSILNYVIFCHQDESLWPISESSILKKKFDEIFDSSKFIKILDSIKLITKEINNDVKLINNNVEHFKNDKIKFENKINLINLLKSQINNNKEIMIKKNLKIDEINSNLQILYTSNQDYERIIFKMESLEQDKKNMIKNIENLKLTTKLINKPKELLLNELNNFTDLLSNQMNQCSKLQDSINLKLKNIEIESNNLNNLLIKNGNLKSLKDKNDLNINSRNEMIEKFSNQLNLKNNLNKNEFDLNLNNKLIFLKNQQNEKINYFNNLINNLMNLINDSKLIIIKESQHIEYKNQDYKTLKNKINELELRFNNISNNQSKLNILKSNIKIKENSFIKIKSLNEISNLNEKIEFKTKEIFKIESNLEENQKKLQITRRNNDLISKLQILKEMNNSEIIEMEIIFKNILKLMPEIEIENILKTKILENYNEKLKLMEIKINKNRAELESKKFKKSKIKLNYENDLINKNNLNLELKNLQLKFNEIKEIYKNIYGDNLKLNEYLNIIEIVENDFNTIFENVNGMQFYIEFNERAIKTAEDKQMCYLCRRKFHKDLDPKHPTQLNVFIELLKNRTEKYKKELGDKSIIEKKEMILNKLKDFKTNSIRLNKLINELIPTIENNLIESEKIIKNYDKEIEIKELEILKLREEFNNFKNILNDVNNYDRLNNSIIERNDQIKRLQENLFEEGLNISIEELENINKDLFSKLKDKRLELESFRTDRDLKQKRNNELENDINQIKLQINDLELKSLDKINIEKAIKENEDQIIEIEKTLKINKLNLENAKKIENENIEKLNNQQNLKDEEINNINKQIQIFEDIKQNFFKIDLEMKEFKDNDIENKFNENLLLIEKCKLNIESIKNIINEDQKNLKNLENLVSDSSNQERNIRSNINLINFEEDLENINEQINQLNIKQAQAQRSEYLKQTSKLQEIQQNLQKDYSTKLGETTQLERQMKDIYNEIDRDYKNIDIKYTNEYAKLQTKLAMATDLTTLFKATDNGVMEFHQTQMQKINNIIDELWKKTYMGNDVETIKIKADPIAAIKKKNDTTATNNRSYNYRVVMIKNGTELDMRGRCSAGQRVLASIIIRIALAECFCLNFGMIALDEPTTNLDDENIESLAKALNAIIKERSVQRNFQLIIITHDEKFLRCMNAVDFTDHYYKVIRDERLNSTINKVSIATVTE